MAIMPILAKASAIAAGTVLLTAAVAYSGGTVSICVRQKTGDGPSHIHLPLPALAGPLAMRLMPESGRHHSPRELQQWIPVIRAAGDELQRCPDVELVTVDNPQETVHISKRGTELVIDVESPRESVHVSFPIRTAVAMVEQWERHGQAQEHADSRGPSM